MQFYNTVVGQINPTNSVFLEMREIIIKSYFPNRFEPKMDNKKLYNEFAAYVCGFINNGRENEISEIFYDFDAVKEAYNKLFSELHPPKDFRKSLNDTRTVNSLVKENEKLREALELAKRELQLTKGTR